MYAGLTSRPDIAPAGVPEVVFKGKGKKNLFKPPSGITVQYTEKGSYNEDTVVHFVENNLRQGETVTDRTPWRILFLDKFAGHVGEKVRQAALKKHYLVLIIPGGLTGDVQV